MWTIDKNNHKNICKRVNRGGGGGQVHRGASENIKYVRECIINMRKYEKINVYE